MPLLLSTVAVLRNPCISLLILKPLGHICFKIELDVLAAKLGLPDLVHCPQLETDSHMCLIVPLLTERSRRSEGRSMEAAEGCGEQDF